MTKQGSKIQIRHDGGFKVKDFAPRLRAAYAEAQKAAETAVQKALICGQILLELKEALGHSNWLPYLKEHVQEIPERTAQRWMELAKRVTEALNLPPVLELSEAVDGSKQLPLSVVLTADPEELPETAREAQQLIFDFTEGKTMKECLEGVVVDGDEPHRITRAHNGATKGGTRGENRKDYPLYFGENLQGALAHALHWGSFNTTQRHEAERYLKLFLGAAPAEMFEFMADAVRDEGRQRDKGKIPEAKGLAYALEERRNKKREAE